MVQYSIILWKYFRKGGRINGILDSFTGSYSICVGSRNAGMEYYKDADYAKKILETEKRWRVKRTIIKGCLGTRC